MALSTLQGLKMAWPRTKYLFVQVQHVQVQHVQVQHVQVQHVQVQHVQVQHGYN